MRNAFEPPILVTKPFLPPLDKFCSGLEEIWASGQLTNNGPLLRQYEDALRAFCRTDNICLFNNGTLALQIALQGMGIKGEVITTPFTFVATTHALYWNKIRPVFCDIEPIYYTIDPARVEELITPRTTAILAVHVFGHPCQVNALADIAKRHDLTLIYDAAHAFGVQVNGRPIGHFGDVSLFSFHATKLYHALEGGMLCFKDPELAQTFNYLKNFGFKSETQVVMPGTNAKMNEMQALMGLQMLGYMDAIISRRKVLYELYQKRLKDIPGIVTCPNLPENVTHNYAYVPVQIDEEQFGMSRDALYKKLKTYNIFSRRYFYPLISDYSCYQAVFVPKPLKVASKVAERILTLPIYPDLEEDHVETICDVILSRKL